MNFNLESIPTTIDLLHVILGAVALLFFVLFLIFLVRPKKTAVESLELKDHAAESAEHQQQLTKKQADARDSVSGKATGSMQSTPATTVIRETQPESAYQLLALLQSEARFVDFISEDLSLFSDQDIGAAARVVQEGSKKTINEYFTITPIKSEQEETSVTIDQGFNPSEIRLTGNVVGQAPFKGTLIHKGWKVTASNLPKLTEGRDTSILAPAEVEL